MASPGTALHHPVVVTGASTGIGRATSERLARAGTPVIAGVRKQTDFDALAAIPGVEPVILDVTKADDVAALAERVRGSALSGLVNNAGSAMPGPLEALPLDDLRAQFELNVFSCVAMAQVTIPALRLGRGRIVNIGSIGGRVGQAYVGAYCGSKGAIHLMSASMRQELRPWKILGLLRRAVDDRHGDLGQGREQRRGPHERHEPGAPDALRHAPRDDARPRRPPDPARARAR